MKHRFAAVIESFQESETIMAVYVSSRTMGASEPNSKSPTAQILIVDDHPIVRTGLRRLIEMEADMTVCGEAEGVEDAIAKFEDLSPDVALLDLSLRDGEGWDVLRHVREHWIGVKIIVVSSWDRINASFAIKAGAMGFVSKQDASDKIITAIRCVLDGRIFVTG